MNACLPGCVWNATKRQNVPHERDAWPRADCAALLEDAFGGGVYGSATMSRKHSGSMTLAAVEDADQASGTKSLLRTLFPNTFTAFPRAEHIMT